MTTDEIIAMAREADPFGEDGRLFAMASVAPGTLERFAALVAAKEREACAQVCDHYGKQDDALILQLVEALRIDRIETEDWPADSRIAIDALRARLERP